MNKFTVVRDTREKPQYGWRFSEDAYCNGTITAKLDTGDYSIVGLEDVLCIERKRTIDEFAHNCIEKRWQSCMKRMAEYKYKFILFEFSWNDINMYPHSSKAPRKIKRNIRISSKFIRKNIHIAREQYGIHVLVCGNTIRAEQIAYRILKKAYEIENRYT